MGTLGRLTAVVAACLATLAAAGSALAAYAPKLSISTAAGDATALNLTFRAGDDQTAHVTIYVPPGYTANLNAAPRTQLGTFTGRVNAIDLAPPAGRETDISGGLETTDPANFAAAAAACAPGPHQAAWVTAPNAPGVTFDPIPIFVDPATGPETAFASYKLQFCFRPPDVPPGTPGRSPQGARILRASFNLLGVFTRSGAASEARWNAVLTPFAPSSATRNVTGTVQAQAVLRAGGRLTLRSRVATRTRGKGRARTTQTFVTLTGSVAPAQAGVRVALLANGRSIGTVVTRANGAFTRTLRVTRTTSFQARATAAASDLAPTCVPQLAPTCASVTGSAFSAQSGTVRVTVRANRR